MTDEICKFHLIHKTGTPLDGLTAESERAVSAVYMGERTKYRVVTCIHMPNTAFGDRILSLPVTPGSLLINEERNLMPHEDPRRRQFDPKSDFGKYISEFRKDFGNLELVYATYERAVSVNLIEKTDDGHKTKFAHVFYERTSGEDKIIKVKMKLQTISGSQKDPDDLIFELQKLISG